MFEFKWEFLDEMSAVEKAVQKTAYSGVRHAAMSIRKDIIGSIEQSQDPAEPGSPVRTRGRRGNVKRSIYAAVDGDAAVIGPRYSFVGDAMEAHEFGTSRFGTDYPARPTSGPALDRNLDRFADWFAGRIGE
jgi:hypothetical protein